MQSNKASDQLSFDMVIDGRVLTIFAESFFSDYSVGIGFGPESVWAQDADGNEVELTEAQELEASEQACAVYDAWHDPEDLAGGL